MMQPQPPTLPNPYAPPQAPHGQVLVGPPGWAPPPPRIDGDRITFAKTLPLPPLCMKCATATDLRGRTQPFAWFPSWTYLLLFLGLLPMMIVQMVVTKRATLLLPLCAPCNSRWTTARVVRTLAILVPVVGGLGLALAGVSVDSGIVAVAGGLLFFPGILLVIPIELLFLRPRILRPVFIDDHVVTLRGVAPRVMDVMARG
jgi:hypothetical protein